MAKVLLVDDEPSIRMVMKRLLSSEGLETVEAEDSASGYRAALEERPDVILLDIYMPGPNGFALLNRLRETPQTKDTPVIIVSASQDVHDEQQGFSNGAVDYITKPWGQGELNDRVRLALSLMKPLPLATTEPPRQQARGAGAAPSGNLPPRRDESTLRFRRLLPRSSAAASLLTPRRIGAPLSPNSGEDEVARLKGVIESAIRSQERRAVSIRFTRIMPRRFNGIDGYEMEGVSTLMVGDIPCLQGANSNFSVIITRDGRIIDRQGKFCAI